MILTFLVRNQTVSYIDTKVTPRVGSSNYLQLKFNFATKDWSSLRKTLHISAGEYSEPFILESSIFDVPTYYTQQESFKITLLGDNESEGTVVPTNVLVVSLDESNSLWTAEPPDPQNSAYIELLNSIGNLNDLTTEAKNNLVAAINEAAQSGGSTVELDTTLTQSGKAADAKAVGDALAGKQNTISDLEAIRNGAAKGATALQSVPSTYRTASEQDTIDDGKVDKVTGKGLSSNDYTDAAKAKVDALAPVATSGNYNDLTSKPTIPTALPNPNALTFTGAVTGSYDGSAPLSVEIPSSSGGGGGSTVELDTTLSEAGKAADAKATGDALAGKQDTLIQSGASVGQIVKISAVDDTGKPTAWEAMNIPEQVQPDWNQNDSTAADYVKNRPIYEKDGIVVPEQSFNFTSQGVVLAQFEDSFVESTEYKVTFDGTEYTCIYANYVIGDLRFKKYPFAIVADSGVLIGVAATASTHTLGLSGKTVHTLSEKLLPHSTVKTMEITFEATEDKLLAAKKHFNSGGVLYLSSRLVNYITGSIDSGGMTFWTQQLNATFRKLPDGSITLKTTYVLTEFPADGVANSYIYLASSTHNSTKIFKITVDDSGTISATEVTTW